MEYILAKTSETVPRVAVQICKRTDLKRESTQKHQAVRTNPKLFIQQNMARSAASSASNADDLYSASGKCHYRRIEARFSIQVAEQLAPVTS